MAYVKEFNVKNTLAHYGSIHNMALSLGISDLSAATACHRGVINSVLAQKLSRVVGMSTFKDDYLINYQQIEELFGMEPSSVDYWRSRRKIKVYKFVKGEPMFRFGSIKLFVEKL